MAPSDSVDPPVAVFQALCNLEDEDAGKVICQALQTKPTLCGGVANFAYEILSTMITQTRMTGTVKHFNEKKGYGFIDCLEAQIVFGKDVFMHKTEAKEVGTVISFNIKTTARNDPQASDCQVTDAPNFRVEAMEAGLLTLGDVMKQARETADQADIKKKAVAEMQQAQQAQQAQQMGWGGQGAGGYDGGWAPHGMAAISLPGHGGAWTPSGKGGQKGGMMAAKGTWMPAAFSKKGAGGPGVGSGLPPEGREELGQFSGQIKSFNIKNGFGFIECEELKQQGLGDVFLHHSQVADFSVEDFVGFTVCLNNKGKPQAKDLLAAEDGLPGSAAKRQRLG